MAKKLLVLFLCVTALFASACGGDEGDTEASDGNQPTQSEEEGSGETKTAPASVEVTTSNFAFKPNRVSVAAGGTIELSNKDDTEHSLTSSQAGVDEDVEAKDSVTIQLDQVDPGTYDFVCKYHSNMTGTLEITS